MGASGKLLTLHSMEQELGVLQAAVISRYEKMKGSFDNDR